MRRLFRFSAFFVSAIALAACGPPPSQESGESASVVDEIVEADPFLTPVYVEEIRRGTIESTVGATGSIVPLRSDALRAEEPGTLRFTKEWQEGDFVEAGTVIANIESATLRKERELAERDILLQEKQLSISKRTYEARQDDYNTVSDLYSRGISARQELDSSKLELDRAENLVSQNEINLEKAKIDLIQVEVREELLIIEAPFDGNLVSRATLEGTGKFTEGFGSESLTSYDGRSISQNHVICGVIQTDAVLMRVDVTSGDISSLAQGQQSDVTVYAEVDILKSGEVRRISNSVNADTAAFEVDVYLDNTDGQLKPGMFGRAEVVTERRMDRVIVPKSALTRRNNENVVFVAEASPDSDRFQAVPKPVEIGLEADDEVEISFGLSSGELIVIRGHEVLQEGALVEPVDLSDPIVP